MGLLDSTVPPYLFVTDAPTAEMYRAVSDGLGAYNRPFAGPNDARPLAVVLQDRDSGAALGGLSGRTLYGWLYIHLLFVPEALRRARLGTQLLHRAEQEARARGCVGAIVETFSFQARPFYERHGYTVFGRVPDFPPGASCEFLSKRLDDPARV